MMDERRDGLKQWLSHKAGCHSRSWSESGQFASYTRWWCDGDEATCSCGLAVALGLKEE